MWVKVARSGQHVKGFRGQLLLMYVLYQLV